MSIFFWDIHSTASSVFLSTHYYGRAGGNFASIFWPPNYKESTQRRGEYAAMQGLGALGHIGFFFHFHSDTLLSFVCLADIPITIWS